MEEYTGIKRECIVLGLIIVMLIGFPCYMILITDDEVTSTHEILYQHGFDNWEEEDQQLLAELMIATVTGESIEPYLSQANMTVLETYIALLEDC